jgi:predicted PurR-regulated permease PerM
MAVYSIKQRRQIILILTIGIGVFLLYTMRNMFPAFLGAVVLYVLFRPFFGWMIRTKKWNSSLSALIVMLSSFVLLVLPFVTVGFMIADKIQLILAHTDEIGAMVIKVQNYFGVDFHNQDTIEKIAGMLKDTVFGGLTSVISGIGSLFLTIGVMYFMLWFMLTSHTTFEITLLKYMPFNRLQTLKFGEELRNSTYSNVIGQSFIAFVQGSLVSIGFLIFGINDPLFWGIISFFVSFLPVVGAPLVFVPAGLISFAYGDSNAGIGIILWGFILVTNIDNVLRFFISKYMADTHPLITILGVIIGIPVFGILGLVFGPLLISWFLLLIRMYEENSDE